MHRKHVLLSKKSSSDYLILNIVVLHKQKIFFVIHIKIPIISYHLNNIRNKGRTRRTQLRPLKSAFNKIHTFSIFIGLRIKLNNHSNTKQPPAALLYAYSNTALICWTKRMKSNTYVCKCNNSNKIIKRKKKKYYHSGVHVYANTTHTHTHGRSQKKTKTEIICVDECMMQQVKC